MPAGGGPIGDVVPARSPAVGVTLAIAGGVAVVAALFMLRASGSDSAPPARGVDEGLSTFFAWLLMAAGAGAATAGSVELDSVPAGLSGQLTGIVLAFMGAGVFVAVDGQELSGGDIGVLLTYAFGLAIVLGCLQAAAVAIGRRRRGGRRARRGAA